MVLIPITTRTKPLRHLCTWKAQEGSHQAVQRAHRKQRGCWHTSGCNQEACGQGHFEEHEGCSKPMVVHFFSQSHLPRCDGGEGHDKDDQSIQGMHSLNSSVNNSSAVLVVGAAKEQLHAMFQCAMAAVPWLLRLSSQLQVADQNALDFHVVCCVQFSCWCGTCDVFECLCALLSS